jgi:hypothetical protein
MRPSSFCSLATYTCHHELFGLLLSLSLYHPGEKVHCLVDSKTKKTIDESTPKIKLNIKWHVKLDKYSGMNRRQMEQKGIWSEFQMMKADKFSFKRRPRYFIFRCGYGNIRYY